MGIVLRQITCSKEIRRTFPFVKLARSCQGRGGKKTSKSLSGVLHIQKCFSSKPVKERIVSPYVHCVHKLQLRLSGSHPSDASKKG